MAEKVSVETNLGMKTEKDPKQRSKCDWTQYRHHIFNLLILRRSTTGLQWLLLLLTLLLFSSKGFFFSKIINVLFILYFCLLWKCQLHFFGFKGLLDSQKLMFFSFIKLLDLCFVFLFSFGIG